MKYALTLLVMMAVSLPAAALRAKGGVFYKMPDGDLVKREATLVHTKGEKGEKDKVSLVFGEKGGLDAKRVVVKKAHGRTVVQMLFIAEPPAKEEGKKHRVAMVFGGTLLKGNNGAVFYGDVYTRKMKPEGLNSFMDTFQDSGLNCEECGCEHGEKECEGGCEGSCHEGKECEGGCEHGEKECEGGCEHGKKECEGGCEHGKKHKHKFNYTGGFGFYSKKADL